jgi:hypothetical protein
MVEIVLQVFCLAAGITPACSSRLAAAQGSAGVGEEEAKTMQTGGGPCGPRRQPKAK